MSNNSEMISFLEVQKQGLVSLLNNNKGKYNQARIEVLEAEIQDIENRKLKFTGGK